MEAVLPPCDVGGELVPVMAVVPTHVTLKRIPEAMAAHVDSVHDMV